MLHDRRALVAGGLGVLQPPQHRLDPRHQLPRGERLGDVVVPAQFQPQHAVDLIIAGRQEDDRRAAGLADTAADLGAVQLRHGDIEHDQVRPLRREALERLRAVPGFEGVEAFLIEGKLHDFADMGVVVDDENAVHLGSQKHRNDSSLSPAQGLEKPLHRLSKY